MTYKRILIAVDESPTSRAALKEAIKLTKDQRATLRILHIVDISLDAQVIYIPPKDVDEYMLKHGEKILKKMQDIAKKAKIKAEIKLAEIKQPGERLAEKIIEEARKFRADLLVIGTHGRRGFHRFFLGSVAEGIIRISTIPVLLIRGKK